jgi:hypothetical protein
MRFITKHLRLLTVGAACAAIGAGGSAIATAGASTPKVTTSAHKKTVGTLRKLARRTIAGDFVVATKSGFATVTIARGRVESVKGQQLTLVEGTPKMSYRTQTLTLPTTVRVRDNGEVSTLAQLSGGQRATVIIAPHRALVIAHTPKSA